MSKKQKTYKGLTVKEWAKQSGVSEAVIKEEIKKSKTNPDK
ncbi:MAG: hypothetical protein AAFQ63_08995 [Cyanobacteria bacterium J06621_11]